MKVFLLCFALILGSDKLFSLNESSFNRIEALFTLKDYRQALKEVDSHLKKMPKNLQLLQYQMRIALFFKEEQKARQILQKIIEISKEEPKQALEEYAWGVLRIAFSSTSLQPKMYALIASYFQQDVQSIKFIASALNSSHRDVKALALRLAKGTGDDLIKDAVSRLYQTEKDPQVRRLLLDAVVHLRLYELIPQLLETLQSSSVSLSEQMVIITTLVSMRDEVTLVQLKKLMQHNLFSMRLLAVKLIERYPKEEFYSFLQIASQDSNHRIQESALSVIGRFYQKFHFNASSLLKTVHPHLAIYAAWVLALQGDEVGEKAIKGWLSDPRPKVRSFAAAAYGSACPGEVTLDFMREMDDPFVKANLALNCFGYRQHLKESILTLFERVNDRSQYIYWDKIGHFRLLQSQKALLKKKWFWEAPEVIDEVARLEVLQLLIRETPEQALKQIKNYLHSHAAIPALAMQLLLRRGDDLLISFIEKILDGEGDEEIRLQAALVLAILGKDPKALQTLYVMYPRVTRRQKEQILEAIGQIASNDSVFFLVKVFNEDFHSLRIIAAASLIQCLN